MIILTAENTMTISNWISIASFLFAVSAFIYSYVTNTKKYELTRQYRTEVLGWYSETINILLRLKTEARSGFKDDELKLDLLCRLSAKIEIGRFYFPNIDKGDGFGKDKPLAYRGYRNLMLDFLVFSYQIFEREDAAKYIDHATALQRHFTSHLYETMDPRSFIRDTQRHTSKVFSKELSFEDFIAKHPGELDLYI
jgi:hypothetical protein